MSTLGERVYASVYRALPDARCTLRRIDGSSIACVCVGVAQLRVNTENGQILLPDVTIRLRRDSLPSGLLSDREIITLVYNSTEYQLRVIGQSDKQGIITITVENPHGK